MKRLTSRGFVSRRGMRDGKRIASRVAVAISTLSLLVASLSSAQIPYEMAYSGRLTNATGGALSETVNLQLRILDQLEDGIMLYIEDHPNVELDENGFFEVPLGSGSVVLGTFEASLFAGMDRHLEVAVNGATLSPRQPMRAVPYAMQAEIAQQASQADAANDAARLEGATLSEVLAMVPSDTEWTAEAGQVTTTNQVVIGAAASPAAETSLHVEGDTVVQGDTVVAGSLVVGDDSIDVLAALAAFEARLEQLEPSQYQLNFDGVSGRACRSDLPSGLLGGAAKFAGAWVRPASYSSDRAQDLFFMGLDTSGGGAPGGQTFALGLDTSERVEVDVSQWNTSESGVSYSVPPGEWSYVFTLWDPSSNEYAIGLVSDGAVSKTYIAPGNSSEQKLSAGPICLGAAKNKYGTYERFFEGSLSDVALLDRVPTDSEILELAAGPSDPSSFPGLLAYWQLNQASGTTVTDGTGNGWDLSLESGAIWSAMAEDETSPKSPICGSLALGATGGRVLVPASAVPQYGEQYTAEAWFRFDSSLHDTGGYLLNHGWGTASSAFQFYLGNSLNLLWETGYGSGWQSIGSTPVLDRAWQHLAAVLDNGQARLYLNGTLVASGSGYSSPLGRAENEAFTVGAVNDEPWGGNYNFPGQIDEVRLSNVARYTEAFTPTTRHSVDANTVLLLHFDQAGATTVVESGIQTGVVGTLQGTDIDVTAVGPDCGTQVTCADGECLGVFDAASWRDAEAFCQSWGGSLAMIRSESKNEAVRAAIGAGSAYIGLHEGGGTCNRQFCWADDLYGNPSLPYTAWASGEPAAVTCGYMEASDGLWRAEESPCNDGSERRFVCERPE